MNSITRPYTPTNSPSRVVYLGVHLYCLIPLRFGVSGTRRLASCTVPRLKRWLIRSIVAISLERSVIAIYRLGMGSVVAPIGSDRLQPAYS